MIAYPTNDLSRDRPLYIRELQYYLRWLGHLGRTVPIVAIDGLFGPETTQAVKALQSQWQMDPSGRVDLATWEAIVQAYRSTAESQAAAYGLYPFPAVTYVMELGDRGHLVTILQIILAELDDRYGNLTPVEVNGRYDETTRRAVQKLQELSGLPADGRTDKNTWNVIVRLFNTQDRSDPNRQ